MPDAWMDRAAFSVFIMAAYLTLPIVALGVLSVTVSAVRQLVLSVGGWLLVPPLLLDLSSAYLHVTYLFHRTREHGQAGLSWFYYAPYSLVGLDVSWLARLIVLTGLTLFHAACQYYAPLYLAKRLGWRPGEGHSAGPGT